MRFGFTGNAYNAFIWLCISVRRYLQSGDNTIKIPYYIPFQEQPFQEIFFFFCNCILNWLKNSVAQLKIIPSRCFRSTEPRLQTTVATIRASRKHAYIAAREPSLPHFSLHQRYIKRIRISPLTSAPDGFLVHITILQFSLLLSIYFEGSLKLDD